MRNKNDAPSGQHPKKRTKRWIVAVLAAVLLLSLLCGCGEQGDGQSGPEAVVERFFNAVKKRDARTMVDCYVPSLREEDDMERAIDILSDKLRDFEILEAEKVDQNTWNYVSDAVCDRSSDEIRIGEIGNIYIVPVFLGSGVQGVFVVQIDENYFIYDM